MSNHQIIGWL